MTYGLNWLLDRLSPQALPTGRRAARDGLHELGAGAYPEFVIHTMSLLTLAVGQQQHQAKMASGRSASPITTRLCVTWQFSAFSSRATHADRHTDGLRMLQVHASSRMLA